MRRIHPMWMWVLAAALVLVPVPGPNPGLEAAPAPLVDTCRPAAATSVSRRQIQELPLSARNPMSLALLQPAIADVTGDGCQDVVAAEGANGTGQLRVFPGYGDGTFSDPMSFPVIGTPTALAIGDVNLDGVIDVAVGTNTGAGSRVNVYGGGVQGNRFVTDNSFAVMGVPSQLAIEDFNGIGPNDIAAMTATQGGQPVVRVLDGATGQGLGSFSAPGASMFASGVSNMPSASGAAADTDRDFFMATPQGVNVVENNLNGSTGSGLGSFFESGTLAYRGGATVGPGVLTSDGRSSSGGAFGDPAYRGGVFVAAGDVNGDGVADVIGTGGAGRVNTFLGDKGVGGYRNPLTTMVGGNPITGLGVTNFNNDAFDDVAVASTGGAGADGSLHMLTGSGTGALTMAQDVMVPSSFGASPWRFGPAFGDPASDDAVAMDPMTGLPTLYGSEWPGAPFAPHPFRLGPGSDFYDLSDMTLSINLGGLLDGHQAMFIEIVVTIILPPAPMLGHLEPVERSASRLARALDWMGTLFSPPSTARWSARWPVAQATPPRPRLSGQITSLGASTGEAFEVALANHGQRAARVMPEVLVVEPRGPARGPASQTAAGASAVKAKTNGYCLDFARETPTEGMAFQVGSPAVQARMRPMKLVLDAANRLARQGLLHPDSDPAAYVDAIKQWSVWTKRENWDVRKFGDAFVERTKKNLAAMKQGWTREIEAQVRSLVPGRWRDISAVMAAAAPR